MNAIISKGPLSASFGGEWIKLGERELNGKTFNTFCNFNDVYEAINVIHITHISCSNNSGLKCTSFDNIQYGQDSFPYYYAYTENVSSNRDVDFVLVKHFWKHIFYNGDLTRYNSRNYWSPVPNEGYTTVSSTVIWDSIYPDAIYQARFSASFIISGNQTVYGLKIS